MQNLFMCVTKRTKKKSSQQGAMVLSDSDDSWSETGDGDVPDESFSTRSMGNQYRGDTTAMTGQSFKRTFVEHRYHDHYHDPLENLPAECLSETQVKRQTRGPRGGVAVAFPEKLHDMLSRMDEEGTNNVISWQPHGRCFLIHKKKDFVNHVMTRFFQQSKLTSFQRQLNLYGFVRLTSGQDRGAYYHELFLRGRPNMCRHMVRTRVKGNGMKAASSPNTEPNFYMMEYCVEGDTSPEAITSTYPEADTDMDDVGSSVDQTNGIPYLFIPEFVTPDRSWSSSPPSSPARVTPQTTPKQNCRAMMDCSSSFLSLPILPQAFGFDRFPALMPSSTASSSDSEDEYEAPLTLPLSGDPVFFEGHVFRYMDHVDLEDYEDPFDDVVAFAVI